MCLQYEYIQMSSTKIENICWRKGTSIKPMTKVSCVPGSIVKLDEKLSNAQHFGQNRMTACMTSFISKLPCWPFIFVVR